MQPAAPFASQADRWRALSVMEPIMTDHDGERQIAQVRAECPRRSVTMASYFATVSVTTPDGRVEMYDVDRTEVTE